MENMLENFKIYKVDVEGRNPNSVNLYINHFKEFCNDMCIENKDEIILTQSQTIKDWLSILAQRGNGVNTRNNKLSAVKQVFAYMEDELMLDIDRRINKIKYAKMPQKETKYLDDDTIEQMMNIIDNQRVKSAISVIKSTGVRFNELMQITCTDIERGFATIIGKGNKERTIWFPLSCIEICNKFINNKRKHIIERTKVDTDLLFISDEGTLMTRQSFTASLKHYAQKIGLWWWKEMSPHKLRHSFITEELNNGVPIQIVRDIAGHSNISTTNRYAHSKEDIIKNVMLKER